MPRDIDPRFNRLSPIDKLNFLQLNKNKAKKKPPKRKPNLRSTRDFRLIIRQSAIDKLQCVIVYRKVTTGEVKRYTICPMSYRYRRLRSGFRKVLFAKDTGDNRQLKMFVVKNIKQAMPTSKKYVPISFPIEIS